MIVAWFLGFIFLSFLIAFAAQIVFYVRDIRYQSQHPEEAFAIYFTKRQDIASKGGAINPPSRDDDPSFGPENAAVEIIAFADFECPFSGEFFSVVKKIEYDFPNDVRFVFRDYPNPKVHPNAIAASQAAECANDQGAFWPMHDKLFMNQKSLDKSSLERYGLQLNLDMSLFTTCMREEKTEKEIDDDVADGIASGVQGTPTIFVNGKKIEGAIPYSFLKKIIETEIVS